MSLNFTSIVKDLRNVTPADRKKAFVDAWLSAKNEESEIKAELDSLLQTFTVLPHDYAIVLRVSQSIPWALDALKTHSEKKVVTSAIDVLESIWEKDPGSFIKQVGGIEGVVGLVDKTLPQIHVVRLFRAFGRPSPLLPEHTSVVDALFHAIFPAFGSPTPITRHAAVAVEHALTSASLGVVKVVLHGWQANSINQQLWTKIAVRRPEIVKQLILSQFEGLEPSPTTGRLDNPQNLANSIGTVLKQMDLPFVDQFIKSYNSYLTHNPTLPKNDTTLTHFDETPIIRIAKLVLEKKSSFEEKTPRLIALSDLLQKVIDHGRKDKLSWYQLDDVISLLAEEFGHSRWASHWVFPSPQQISQAAGTPTIIGVVAAFSGHVKYKNDEMFDDSFGIAVGTIPRKARLPFCHIFYATHTGASLLEVPENKLSFPQFAPEMLAVLHPHHGRSLLDVGLKARGENFISTNWFDAESKIDTQTLLSAAWVGVERGILGDLGVVDEEQAKAAKSQIIMFKKQASKAKTPQARQYSVKMALVTCKVSHSPALFAETLSWAFDRYAKDPETSGELLSFLTSRYLYDDWLKLDRFLAGPVGLYVSAGTKKTFSLEVMSVWTQSCDKALRSYLKLFKIWIKEPNHGQERYWTIDLRYEDLGKLYFKVLKARIKLMEQIYPILSGDTERLTAILLEPMADIILEAERFRVIDNPLTLKFELSSCTPKRFDTLQITRRISSPVQSFLLDFERKRKELHKEGRQHLLQATQEQLFERYQSFSNGDEYPNSPLPCSLIITRSIRSDISLRTVENFREPNRKHVYSSVESSDSIRAYIDTVLFKDLDAKPSSEDSLGNWTASQFPEALQLYLRTSADLKDLVTRVSSLYELYAEERGGRDYRTFLLKSSMVPAVIAADTSLLVKVVGPWLPTYPPPLDSREDDVIIFDFVNLMPWVSNLTSYSDDTPLMVLRNPHSEGDYRLDLWKKLFKRPTSGRYAHHAPGALPRSFSDRVTVLAIAWILSLLHVPTTNAQVGGGNDDPVSYAIRHIRIPEETVEATAKNNIAPTAMLSRIVDTLSNTQINTFATVVFTAEKVEANLTLMMRVLHVIRRVGRPGVGLEQVWEVLGVPGLSSWHRMALTGGVVRCQGPGVGGARGLVERFLVFNQEGRRSRGDVQVVKEVEGEEDVGEGEEDGGEEEESKPKEPDEDPNFYKVSTEKMAVQTVGAAFRAGVIDFEDINGYAEKGLFVVTPSIYSNACDVLVESAIQTLLLHGGDKSDIWDPLIFYIQVGQRLAESQEVTEEQWSAAISSPDVPMPLLVEEYPVAHSLLRLDLPLIIRAPWAKNVVEPLLLGHVGLRTRWLRAAIAREGEGGDEIAATFSDALPFVHAFRDYAPWLTYEGQEPVVQIVRKRISVISARSACKRLVDLVDGNHPSTWKGTVYGRALVALVAYATRDESVSRISTLQDGLLGPVSQDNYLPSWLVERISSELVSIAADLLEPEHLMFDPTRDPTTVQPLSSFSSFFNAHKEHMDSKVVRDLCNEYIRLVETRELAASLDRLNGGAKYWNTIIRLKLALAFNKENAEDLAAALAESVSAVANGWHSVVNLPDTVQSHFKFPPGHVLAKDIVTLVEKLTQEPLCPSEAGVARSLTFMCALSVLRANAGEIKGDFLVKVKVDRLIEGWKRHEDGAVQYLADTFTL